MNIGSMFISLGIKGSEKTIGALKNIRSGLKEATSFSLETKAGILGAAYALEQFLAKSANQATVLANMSEVLGVSTDTLQTFANAAMESGTSLETVAGSMEGMQESLTNLINTGKGMGDWFTRFMQVSGTAPEELRGLAQHPDVMMQRLQKYVDLEKKMGTARADINMVLKNLGLQAMIPAFERGDFEPEKLAKAAKMPALGVADVSALDKARQQLAEIGKTIEVTVGRLGARFGPALLKDFGEMLPKVTQFAEALGKVATQLHVIKGIGKIFEGWKEIFNGLLTVVDAFSDPKKMAALKANVSEFLELMPGVLREFLGAPEIPKPSGTATSNLKEFSTAADMVKNFESSESQKGVFDRSAAMIEAKRFLEFFLGNAPTLKPPAIPTPRPSETGNNQSNNVDVHQSFNIGDKSDLKAIADAAAHGIKTAFYQNPALGRFS